MSSIQSDEAKFFLAAIVESSQDSIVTINLDGIITTWNKAAEMLYGYSSSEAIGKPLTMVTLPGELQHLLQNIEDIRHLQKVEIFDTVRRHKDGHDMYLEVMVSPVKNGAGNVIGISTIARDINRRKQAEEALKESQQRLRITMESATEYAIITFDINGNITTWSKGAELIFGYTESEATGRNTSLIFTPEDVASGEHLREMEKAKLRGCAEDERWHMRAEGHRIFVSGVMQPLVSEDGLIGYVKVAREMTERKLLEQQKDDFIGVTSHELKTPVTSIKAYVELLRENLAEAGDTENTNLAEKLDAQVDRLTQLIHTLLDITRISEGKVALLYESFRLDNLVQERIDEMQQLYPGRKLVLNGSQAVVTADRERIGQVLTNLLSNAIKYSPDDSEVVVTTGMTGAEVSVSVRDLGIGIPQASRQKVFERFYRVSENGVNTYSGLGLGLFIASQIVKQHGGTIGVDSTPGEGSVFYFTLPVEVKRDK